MVGEGGVAPEYFLHSMQMWEARLFLRGLQRRYRQQWEQTRWASFIHCKLLGAKLDDMQELATFPWEVETVDKEEEERHLQELIRQCKEENLKRDK